MFFLRKVHLRSFISWHCNIKVGVLHDVRTPLRIDGHRDRARHGNNSDSKEVSREQAGDTSVFFNFRTLTIKTHRNLSLALVDTIYRTGSNRLF